MSRLIKKLFFYNCCLISVVYISNCFAAVDIKVEVNNPVVLTNLTGNSVNMICEIHANSAQTHFITLLIAKGRGVFNGTSYKKGDTMTSSLANLQQIAVSADAGTQVKVTNNGPTSLLAICNL